MNTNSSVPARRREQARSAGVRLSAIVVGLGLWFWTQSLIGARGAVDGCVGDAVHHYSSGAHRWLTEVPFRADCLLVLSTLVIDVVGVFLILSSIFGRTIRPFLGLLIIFALRQQRCDSQRSGERKWPPPPSVLSA